MTDSVFIENGGSFIVLIKKGSTNRTALAILLNRLFRIYHQIANDTYQNYLMFKYHYKPTLTVLNIKKCFYVYYIFIQMYNKYFNNINCRK